MEVLASLSYLIEYLSLKCLTDDFSFKGPSQWLNKEKQFDKMPLMLTYTVLQVIKT